MNRNQFLCAATLFLLTIGSVGCGGDSNVGSVHGTVTLDGQPVAGALITFSPTKTGAPSNARTDSDGKYSLVYTRSIDGAEIGEHTVTITTYEPANPDREPPTPAVPEKIPAKYNSKTELKKEVTSGRNTIDFELKSDGPIIQPTPTK